MADRAAPHIAAVSAAGRRDAAGMEHLRQLSKHTRAVHTERCQQLSKGSATLEGLCAQALFDRDVASLSLRRALIAMPNLGRIRASRVLAQVALPATRRVGWLAQHPDTIQKIQNAIQQVLYPARRQPPTPNWPWFGKVTL